MALANDDLPLEILRDDLEISSGAPFLSGAPGWIIRDPVRHRFFQIGQRTIDILSRWSAGTVGRLKAQLLAEKAITLEDAELEALTRFLRQNQLLEGGTKGIASQLVHADRASGISRALTTAQKVLFVRFPLVHPKSFLAATWPIVRPLFSRGFIALTAVFLAIGLYLASRQVADIEAHIRQSFSWNSAILFIAAIAVIKILHEFGHAYQAVSRGVRVPVMGVAFFAFLPLLYTDSTDAWRLHSRRDRVMIDLGGIFAELTIAVYATLAWCFLADGPARTIAFAVATSSWVLSLFVNLNPFMRFDGYYLLSDSLGIQNLQNRSFALAKWAMRRALFGLGDPAPEPMGPAARWWLITYAYGVWIYRFFLFVTIALLVYAMFFKLAGVILLAIAIGGFIVKPVVAEVQFWFKARQRIAGSRRGLVTFSLFALLVVLAVWPISTRVRIPAIYEDAGQQMIFPPEAARLVAVLVSQGETVSAGDPLLEFEHPELSLRLEQSRTRIELNKARLLSTAGDASELVEGTVIARILDEEIETLSALEDRRRKLTVAASMDGQVRELASGLAPGVWYPRDAALGRIVAPGVQIVRGFIREADLDRLDPRRAAMFVADDLSIPPIELNNLVVSEFSVERLPDGYLSRPNGGPIAIATSEPGQHVVAGVWYPVSARPVTGGVNGGAQVDQVHRGVIVSRSTRQSLAYRVGQRIARVLIRELEF